MVISNELDTFVDTDGLLARILEVTKDAVIVVDDSSKIVVFNHGAEAIFHFSADEAIDQPLSIILPDIIKDLHHRLVEKFDRDHPVEGELVEMGANWSEVHPTGYEDSYTRDCSRIVGVRKNGEEFPIDATVTKLCYGGRKFFTAIVRDVTERVNHLQRIRTQQAELEQYRRSVKRQLLAEVKGIANIKAEEIKEQ